MKKTILFILLAFSGCMDTEENASLNLKKGDSFFEKKEYEVAEYYYERIPEDSPLYTKAKRKLDEIALIKKHWVEKEVPADDVPKITILNHNVGMDNVRHIPSHTLELFNNLSREVKYITAEFTYADANGTIVGKLKTEVKISLYPNTRGSFSAIEPGYVAKAFSSSSAKIISARFN